MIMGKFDICIPVILRHEGGYVNNPNDPGGETKYGISKRAFPQVDIKALTVERAKEIYRRHYWERMNLEGIEDLELALHVFDHGVNAGPKTAIRILQRIARVKVDGLIGPCTLRAVNLSHLKDGYEKARIEYYIKIAVKRPRLKIFLKGWINRVGTTHI